MRNSKLNVLVAYPYFSEGIVSVLERNKDYRLIVDSGAFSAYNCGLDIKLPDYCDFLRMLHKRLPKFESVQLDVVFNHEETEINYNKMMDMGLNTNPVFTRGAPISYLMDLLAKDKYVFVGGVQGGSGAREFAKFVLERSKGKRVHYLAFVRSEFLKYYKPYSTDASSWAGAARFGNLGLYCGNGKMRSVNKSEFKKRPNNEIIKLIQNLGFTYSEIKYLGRKESWTSDGRFGLDKMTSLGTNSKSFALFVNICSFIYHSIRYEEMIGTKVYLAIPTPQFMEMFFEAKKFMTDRGVI